MLLLTLPMKQWGQTPYRQYAEDGIMLNFFEINHSDLRLFLLYNLNQDERITLTPEDENGLFIVSSSDVFSGPDFFDYFESVYNKTMTDFRLIDKADLQELVGLWKSCVPPVYFTSITIDIALDRATTLNNHCVDSDPFCTSDVISFAAATSSQTADQLEGTTVEDGCIGSSYSPAWFHMRIQTGGQFIIHAEGHDPNNGTNRDIDFCIWGPFTNPTTPCVAQLTTSTIIDCCYSASYSENIYLGYPGGQHNHGSSSHGTITEHTPVTGEYYILMITNFSQNPCTITFSKTPNSGPGETDCGILPGVADNDGPYCVGETIHLTVNAQDGATYSWTGPGGFTSTQQNPVRPNCTLNMAGTYTCVTTVGNQTTTATTEVVIFPQPTANFNFSTECVGNATQFNSTSTTNPTGQQIQGFQWNFGDGQTGTGQSVSHTYAQAGTYQVTLTVSCGNGHCTDQITKPVTVNPLPTASFTYVTACNGDPVQFNGSATGQGITNYQWNFGDGQTGSGQHVTHVYAQAGTYQVTLTVSAADGSCSGQVTQTVSVIAAPVADAGPDQTIGYGSTAQLSGSGGAGSFTFHWEPANMVTNPNSQNTQTVALTQDQTYTLTVTNPQGECSDTDEVTIHISGSAMTVNATASPNSICEGSTTQLQANAGGGTGNFTYSWTPTTGLSDPSIYNPIATPTQTTTYTCTVSDGQTTQTVSVTVTVHYPGTSEETIYICPDETLDWHGSPYNAIGDYTYLTQTQYGCDSIITLHLQHYPTYDETVITEAICPGESYEFYGTLYTETINTSYTDHTSHGCDSIVRLNLTVYDDNGETPHPVTVCPNQLPYYYEEDPNQIPLYTPCIHYYHLTDIHGCDSTVVVELSVSDYYIPPTQTVHTCDPSFTWSVNGQTYYQDIFVKDTLPTEDCDAIYSLDLHFQQVPEVEHVYVTTCDSYDWWVGDVKVGTYTHSCEPTYSIPLTPFPCERTYQLHLTINTQDKMEDLLFTDKCDAVQSQWPWPDTTFYENTVYKFTGETEDGCYREQTYIIENMQYTPAPVIRCSDQNVESPHHPITATEFNVNRYTYFASDPKSDASWYNGQCEWSISKPSWRVETSADNRSCTVYAMDWVEDTIWLYFKAVNPCSEEGIVAKYWLKPSFYGIEELDAYPASVDIVPNPNNGQMELRFENMNGHLSIRVYNVTGALVDNFELKSVQTGDSYQYAMKQLQNGVYFFSISDGKRSITKKVVIIH